MFVKEIAHPENLKAGAAAVNANVEHLYGRGRRRASIHIATATAHQATKNADMPPTAV